MHAARLSPYLWCSLTRLGNSFMHGWQLVDQASRTTIFFPLWPATNFSVSSQLAVSSETFAFGFSPGSFTAADFFSAGFSSPAICETAIAPVRQSETTSSDRIDGLITGGLHSERRNHGTYEMNRRTAS